MDWNCSTIFGGSSVWLTIAITIVCIVVVYREWKANRPSDKVDDPSPVINIKLEIK